MDSIPAWFPGVTLNYAENMLFSPSSSDSSVQSKHGKEDDKIAVTEVREGCTEIRDVTWRELRAKVARLSNAMRTHGVSKGDRVAVVASHSVDTLAVFLAVTALGGIFSSSSTDMGTKGVLDRLLQIRPVWVFVDDAALYNGKIVDLRTKMGEISRGMEGVKEFKGLVSVPRYTDVKDISSLPKTITLEKYLKKGEGDAALRFERVGFMDPFLIVYSSGTTGIPKCIVHSVGGVLISRQKEARLHSDLGPDTVYLQYTTTGWIMYLTAVSVLQHGARAVLYDGSPFQPDLTTFVRLLGDQRVTDLGISPRYLQTLASANPPVLPRQITDLGTLRSVSSTGMVLSDSLFEWFYDCAFPPSVQLCNISGGTDIAACFGLQNPITPVYVGGCQGPGLGIKLEVYDQLIEGGPGVKGQAVPIGEPGELVATAAFPNQPVCFWGDEGGKKYFDAYFSRFDDVWTHGDFITIHPVTGGVYFLGRADGVLNPSGVRFGSAEIYSVVETHFGEEVQDSVCVGQRRPRDTDESVVLFLLMKPGKKFSQSLVKRVQDRIAKECSKRHVPKYVFETPEIPVRQSCCYLAGYRQANTVQTTVNLKKVELPVKRIISGETVKPSGTLLNPESLQYYYQFAKVEELAAPKSKL